MGKTGFENNKIFVNGNQIIDDNSFLNVDTIHAVFSDSTTQTITSATVPWAVTFDTTENGDGGITLGRTATVTISNASPGVVTWTGHGLYVDSPVVFTTDGELPTGLTAGKKYYIISAGFGVDSFQVSATPQGAAVNTHNVGNYNFFQVQKIA